MAGGVGRLAEDLRMGRQLPHSLDDRRFQLRSLPGEATGMPTALSFAALRAEVGVSVTQNVLAAAVDPPTLDRRLKPFRITAVLTLDMNRVNVVEEKVA